MLAIKLRQNGDTIVEVLIAILIISMVLGGAFAASNRSSRSLQQAQEHTTALKIAEGQVELLKSLSAGNSIYNAADLFCIDSSGTVHTDWIKDSTGTNPITINSPGPSMPTTNSAADNLNYGNCRVPGGVTYNYAVDRLSNPVVFVVHVRWDSIQGDGHDEVTLSYKTN